MSTGSHSTMKREQFCKYFNPLPPRWVSGDDSGVGSDIWDSTSRSDSDAEWPVDKGDMWARSGANSLGPCVSGDMVGWADGFDLCVCGGVHHDRCGEVEHGDVWEPSDNRVVRDNTGCDMERGEVAQPSDDRVMCEEKGWVVKRGDVVEFFNDRVVCEDRGCEGE